MCIRDRAWGRASAWRSASSVEVMYGPSKKREKVHPSAVSTVSAAATARSPVRIRKRHPASRVAVPPSAVTRSRTCTGRGSSGEAGPWAPSSEGVRASLTAVGEESAVSTERSAGAGAGGTCSGMVGRLSFEGTVARGRGRAWRGGRRCQLAKVREAGTRGSERGGRGGELPYAVSRLDRSTVGANLLPCGRSLYDACSDYVSSSRSQPGEQGYFWPVKCENHPDSGPGVRR